MNELSCRCRNSLTTPLAPWCQHFGECPLCSCEGPFTCTSCDSELSEVCQSVGNQRRCDHEPDCYYCVCEPRWDDESFEGYFSANRSWLGQADFPIIALYNAGLDASEIGVHLQLPAGVVMDLLTHFGFVTNGLSISAQPMLRDGEEITSHEKKNIIQALKQRTSLQDMSQAFERCQLDLARIAISERTCPRLSASRHNEPVESIRTGWKPEDVSQIEEMLEKSVALADISMRLGRSLEEVLDLVVKYELGHYTTWLTEFKAKYEPFKPYPLWDEAMGARERK